MYGQISMNTYKYSDDTGDIACSNLAALIYWVIMVIY